MDRSKSSRNGVHNANGLVWEPVWIDRTIGRSIERSVDRSIADGPAVGSFLRIEGRTGKRREAYERGNDTTTTTTTTTTT